MSWMYMSRVEWGADTTLPRLGWNVPFKMRKLAIMHHTVVIDDDATPNLWETEGEVKAKMRQLQRIRPDLGLDVPYNFVGFLMAESFTKARLIVAEGRGWARSGAHTRSHDTEGNWLNDSGIALAIEGNTNLMRDFAPHIPPINAFWFWLKSTLLPNLGEIHPQGRSIWGHRDFRPGTECPGTALWAAIGKLGFEEEQEDSMAVILVKQSDVSGVFLTDWIRKRPVDAQETVFLQFIGVRGPIEIDPAILQAIPGP